MLPLAMSTREKCFGSVNVLWERVLKLLAECAWAIARTDTDRNSSPDVYKRKLRLNVLWEPIAGAESRAARSRGIGGQGPTHAAAATSELQKHLV